MLKAFVISRKVEDARWLNITCEAADTRDKCHQVPRVQNRVAGQENDDLGAGCLYSPQVGLMQKMEGTHKLDDAVSKATCNSWGGVPIVMLPM